jgi:acyl-CoA thioesterase FadM
MEKRGLSVEHFKKRGFAYVVRQCNISYRSPARYGDTVKNSNPPPSPMI